MDPNLIAQNNPNPIPNPSNNIDPGSDPNRKLNNINNDTQTSANNPSNSANNIHSNEIPNYPNSNANSNPNLVPVVGSDSSITNVPGPNTVMVGGYYDPSGMGNPPNNIPVNGSNGYVGTSAGGLFQNYLNSTVGNMNLNYYASQPSNGNNLNMNGFIYSNGPNIYSHHQQVPHNHHNPGPSISHNSPHGHSLSLNPNNLNNSSQSSASQSHNHSVAVSLHGPQGSVGPGGQGLVGGPYINGLPLNGLQNMQSLQNMQTLSGVPLSVQVPLSLPLPLNPSHPLSYHPSMLPHSNYYNIHNNNHSTSPHNSLPTPHNMNPRYSNNSVIINGPGPGGPIHSILQQGGQVQYHHGHGYGHGQGAGPGHGSGQQISNGQNGQNQNGPVQARTATALKNAAKLADVFLANEFLGKNKPLVTKVESDIEAFAKDNTRDRLEVHEIHSSYHRLLFHRFSDRYCMNHYGMENSNHNNGYTVRTIVIEKTELSPSRTFIKKLSDSSPEELNKFIQTHSSFLGRNNNLNTNNTYNTGASNGNSVPNLNNSSISPNESLKPPSEENESPNSIPAPVQVSVPASAEQVISSASDQNGLNSEGHTQMTGNNLNSNPSYLIMRRSAQENAATPSSDNAAPSEVSESNGKENIPSKDSLLEREQQYEKVRAIIFNENGSNPDKSTDDNTSKSLSSNGFDSSQATQQQALSNTPSSDHLDETETENTNDPQGSNTNQTSLENNSTNNPNANQNSRNRRMNRRSNNNSNPNRNELISNNDNHEYSRRRNNYQRNMQIQSNQNMQMYASNEWPNNPLYTDNGNGHIQGHLPPHAIPNVSGPVYSFRHSPAHMNHSMGNAPTGVMSNNGYVNGPYQSGPIPYLFSPNSVNDPNSNYVMMMPAPGAYVEGLNPSGMLNVYASQSYPYQQARQVLGQGQSLLGTDNKLDPSINGTFTTLNISSASPMTSNNVNIPQQNPILSFDQMGNNMNMLNQSGVPVVTRLLPGQGQGQYQLQPNNNNNRNSKSRGQGMPSSPNTRKGNNAERNNLKQNNNAGAISFDNSYNNGSAVHGGQLEVNHQNSSSPRDQNGSNNFNNSNPANPNRSGRRNNTNMANRNNIAGSANSNKSQEQTFILDKMAFPPLNNAIANQTPSDPGNPSGSININNPPGSQPQVLSFAALLAKTDTNNSNNTAPTNESIVDKDNTKSLPINSSKNLTATGADPTTKPSESDELLKLSQLNINPNSEGQANPHVLPASPSTVTVSTPLAVSAPTSTIHTPVQPPTTSSAPALVPAPVLAPAAAPTPTLTPTPTPTPAPAPAPVSVVATAPVSNGIPIATPNAAPPTIPVVPGNAGVGAPASPVADSSPAEFSNESSALNGSSTPSTVSNNNNNNNTSTNVSAGLTAWGTPLPKKLTAPVDLSWSAKLAASAKVGKK